MHLPELPLFSRATRRAGLDPGIRLIWFGQIAEKIFNLARLHVLLIDPRINLARILGAERAIEIRVLHDRNPRATAAFERLAMDI